ncbi:MAG: tetratricopeptide repeat protein [Spirochaetales bacterium]|nr:tetratricopeptide repeat protein [Spirochaetales bacterium]
MMKKTIFTVILVVITALLLSSCNEARKKTLERILRTESGDYENEKVSKERIKELEEGIEEYYRDVERVVKANAEIGIYYRMLALEYMDLEMYHYALENLEKSMEFYPTNPVLSHYAGLAKANIARAEISESNRLFLLHEAETYYLTAVRLRRDYTNAMYALAVLYMFDLNRPYKAAPLLEEMLSRDPHNWEAKILYARFKVVSGDVDAAIELYNEISEDAWDDDMKEQAGKNRDSLLAGQS